VQDSLTGVLLQRITFVTYCNNPADVIRECCSKRHRLIRRWMLRISTALRYLYNIASILLHKVFTTFLESRVSELCTILGLQAFLALVEVLPLPTLLRIKCIAPFAL